MRRIHRVTISLAAAISLISLYTTPTLAATTAITGGSYGASCSSGGYFTPSSVTINSGDAVTISVPSNDPYSGGIEVHGFPQGNFVVARGGSVTTKTLTSNVSYYATWPNAGCTKGSGTITVSAPAPPPPPPAPTPPPSPTPQATPTPSGISSNTKAGPSSSTPSASASSPSPAPEPTPQPPSSTATNHSTPTSADTTATNTRRISAKNVAVVSGGALMLIAIALVAWRLILRRRTPAAGGLSTKPPQDNDDPHNQTPTTT